MDPTPGPPGGGTPVRHPRRAGVDLPGGLVLRPMDSSDLDRAVDLVVSRGDPSDGVDLRLVAADPDGAAVAVVADGDRVVSTATLLDETLVVDGLAVPAGQVELVATDPAYEGRGLVRSLMAWAHEQSAARGHLAQVMIGIPFFYRQFGYSYAVPMRHWRRLVAPPAAAGGVAVRRATTADVAAMDAVETAEQRSARLAMPHSPACWRWLVARDGSRQWVAERGGEVVATGRSTPPEEGDVLAGELAAVDAEAALAVVAHVAGEAAAAGRDVTVQERPGTVAGAAVDPLLAPAEGRPEWYYARVPDLAALLAHLGPVLARRLADAGVDGDHELLLSTYRSHLRCRVGPGGVADLAAGGPLQAPVAAGGSGVPPDAVAPLLFGPHGAAGLTEVLPDCNLGRQADLMAALFPPLTADLLTFYLPA